MIWFVMWSAWTTAAAKVPDEPSELTETQALAIFYTRNLDLIAAHFNVDQALAQEIIAGAIPNPQISLAIYELSGKSDFKGKLGGLGPAYGFAISQLLETAGKRGLRMDSSRLGREAVEADFRDALRTLSNTLRHRFYELLLAQKTRDLAEENVARYAKIVRANRLRYSAGDISKAEQLRIEVESLKAEADLDNAEAALKQARANLARLMAWPEYAGDLTIADEWPAYTEAIIDGPEEQLIHSAFTQRPDLKGARLRVDQAEKDLALARRLNIPDVTVTASYARDPANNVLDTGGLSLSVPLPLFYQHKGEISAAVVSLNAARTQLDLIQNDIRTEVVSASAQFRSANSVARRFESEVLSRITDLRRANDFAFARGGLSLLELLDSERNYKTMMLDYYSALADRAVAYADLLKALGNEESRP